MIGQLHMMMQHGEAWLCGTINASIDTHLRLYRTLEVYKVAAADGETTIHHHWHALEQVRNPVDAWVSSGMWWTLQVGWFQRRCHDSWLVFDIVTGWSSNFPRGAHHGASPSCNGSEPGTRNALTWIPTPNAGDGPAKGILTVDVPPNGALPVAESHPIHP